VKNGVAGSVCFVCHFIFSFYNHFFLRGTRDGFEGVQRRAAVKGAACPRSSRPLTASTAVKTPVLERAGVVEKKMIRRKVLEKR
jgi:hypothetical protein